MLYQLSYTRPFNDCGLLIRIADEINACLRSSINPQSAFKSQIVLVQG